MSKFKITKADIKEAELMKTVVTEPIWLPAMIKAYNKSKADDGSDLHKFQATVLASENPEANAYAGMTLFLQYSEKKLGFIAPLLAAVGCPSDGEGGFELEDMKDLISQKFDAYVVPSVYEGKKRNNVEDYRPLQAA